MIKFADVIVDISYGDCGKGAVCYELAKKDEYTHVMRFNGGPNAGHTIYHNGNKFVTHIIPTGIFHDKTCIIGPGCVLNVKKFFEEIDALERFGIRTWKKIFIAENTHIITDEHIQEELNESKIGTTKQGVGPCYRDKYNRTGVLAKDVKELSAFTIDIYEYLYNPTRDFGLLLEGAQGFHLDIDWGDYPYVSSSHATVGGAILNGIPHNAIRKVYGCAKAYDTYVGLKKFQPDEAIFDRLRDLGKEYGSTTGRARQCNWINVKDLIKAIEMNQCTDVIISKVDVLKELNKENDDLYWCVKRKDGISYFDSVFEWKIWLEDEIMDCCESVLKVKYRYSPTDPVE